MKKKLLLLISLVFALGIFAALPAAASPSEYYYINAPILKIFPHRLGYYVIYRRVGSQIGEAFIPLKWLQPKDQRAVLNLTTAYINPYLTFVMHNGEFDHVCITAAKDTNNATWGVLTSGTQYNDNFNIEKLDLKF
jgi:hypothetical protein